MAAALTVPKQYQNGYAKIRDLDDESFRELLAALQKIPSTISFTSLASAVAAMVDTIAVSDVEEIVPAASFLHTLEDGLELSVSEVAERIARGMEEIAPEKLKSPPDRNDAFQARLLEILKLDSLSITARAGGLSIENERSLSEARIITDIRPIFERKNPQAPPAGAVIIHTLKISYRDDNQRRSFFVTLDNDGILELSEQLERASSKAESLKSVLKAAQVPYIDAE